MKELSGDVDTIDVDEFIKKSLDDKLVTIVSSMNKIHAKYDILSDAICHETEGVEAKLALMHHKLKT